MCAAMIYFNSADAIASTLAVETHHKTIKRLAEITIVLPCAALWLSRAKLVEVARCHDGLLVSVGHRKLASARCRSSASKQSSVCFRVVVFVLQQLVAGLKKTSRLSKKTFQQTMFFQTFSSQHNVRFRFFLAEVTLVNTVTGNLSASWRRKLRQLLRAIGPRPKSPTLQSNSRRNAALEAMFSSEP